MPDITRPELERILKQLDIGATQWQIELLLRVLQSDEPLRLARAYRSERQESSWL